MKREFNLFGEPLPLKQGQPGRNDHVPTPENVSRVRLLVIAGWTTDKIAEEIGISRPTLRKHYLPDIEKARTVVLGEVKAKVLMQLMMAAEDGNVAAMKELLRMVREGELVEGVGAPGARPAEKPKAPLGKKEQAGADAHTGHEGTTWGELLGTGARPN